MKTLKIALPSLRVDRFNMYCIFLPNVTKVIQNQDTFAEGLLKISIRIQVVGHISISTSWWASITIIKPKHLFLRLVNNVNNQPNQVPTEPQYQ